MPKTAVGLFENATVAEAVTREIESLGFPHNEVGSLEEPLDFGVHGVTSIPRVDFEVNLTRELMRIGATPQVAKSYIEGLRHGEVLVFATGPADKVDAAAELMNRFKAVEHEEVTGAVPNFPSLAHKTVFRECEPSVQAGRLRSSESVSAFVW